MDLPSEIKVNLDLDKTKRVEAVWVGGSATILKTETS
jgi:predicted PhzF superfamily epimerase YddE/YHI9